MGRKRPSQKTTRKRVRRPSTVKGPVRTFVAQMPESHGIDCPIGLSIVVPGCDGLLALETLPIE